MKFEELNISPEILSRIRDSGFRELTHIQEKCMREILEGRDVVGQAETGSGNLYWIKSD